MWIFTLPELRSLERKEGILHASVSLCKIDSMENCSHVLQSALSFNAAMGTSVFLKDQLFNRKVVTVSLGR